MGTIRFPRAAILAGAGLVLAACQAPAPAPDAPPPPTRPNVLFIAVDDLRPELGAYGQTHIHSPNIDRLASEGLLFERAYVQQAVCSPSRTSLMTGLRPDATQVWDLQTHFRDTVPDVVTLPQHFMRNGYHAEWWGKLYHASLLDEASWTRQGQRFEPESNWRAYITDEANALAAANEGGGPPFERGDVPDEAYPDGKIANHAIEALQRLAKGEGPFFLAVGFYKPHLPFNAPAQYWDLYDPASIQPPDFDHAPEGTPEIALMNWGELRAYSGIPRTGDVDRELARQLIHGYRACVSYTDAHVGRVLDELERLGLRDSTIVVLWGDHGWKLGEYGDWCKHSNFEIDTRAPLIVSAPGMEARGQSTSALVELVDLYPTLVELAGLPLPDHLQGTSFAPLLQDPTRPWKATALSQYPRGTNMGRSMRTDRYRFTEWRSEDGAVIARELYDHQESDPLEVRNLAEDPDHAETVKRLEALLEDRWEESLSGAPPARLVLRDPVHHLDGLGREPMLVEHPDGTLFVSGYESQVRGTDPRLTPRLWKSTDGGQSWDRVAVGTPKEGAAGNSDVDLAVGPDGTLYFVVMGFNRTTGEGTHIAMGVSHDVGASWSWTSLSETRFDDRPWVEVAPDGTAHAIWNDGAGVSHAVSTDRGRTWEERPRVHPTGGSSHLAIGPAGKIAVRVSPLSASGNRYDEGEDLIVVSTDGGRDWQAYAAPGTRDWPPSFADMGAKLPRWVEPVAWDADGALCHLWSEGQDLVLARSVDQGATWTRWVVANDGDAAYFPYLVARGSGELAATWFSGAGESLEAHVALIQLPQADGHEPVVLRSKPFQPDSWLESQDSPGRTPAGEYLPVAFLSGGGLAVVTPVQDSRRDRFGFSWWTLDPR